MLGLFSPKLAHPLADEKERQRILGEIAGADAPSALKNSVDWLKTLADASAMPFGLRAMLVRQIDDAAQLSAHIVGREYLTMAHLSAEEEMRLWRASRVFWARLAATYHACLADFMRSSEKPESQRAELTRIAARLVRAYRTRLKWDQFRYWPGSEALWQNIGRAYLYALDNGFARREVSAYPGDGQQTTVEGEYLNALVFQISSMDGLLPFEIDIAERLIARFTARFELSTDARAGFAYCVDPEQRIAPGRVYGKPERSLSRFYFCTTGAEARLLDIQQMLERGQLPAEVDFARYHSPRILLPVVRHLVTYWAPQKRKRAHNRYRDQSKLAVVVGMGLVQHCLAVPEPAEPPATWVVENVSLGGVHIRLPMGPADHLRIGTLLGMRPEGGENWLVGVVRRFARRDEFEARAGVETLSRKPILAVIAGEVPSRAILLDPIDEGETVRLVVSGYRPDRPLSAEVLGTTLALEPVELLERGVEFELGRYRVTGCI
jgi:hypothetical protein